MKLSKHILSGVMFVGLTTAAGAQGAVLVEDRFVDGGETDGADTKDVNFQRYTTGSTTLSIVADEVTGPDEGPADNALKVAVGGQGFRGVYGIVGTSTTLASVGDSINLSFDFKFATANTTTSPTGIRFGLYNSNGTSAATDDDGYFARIGTGSNMTADVLKEDGEEVILSGGDGTPLSGSGSGGGGVGGESVHFAFNVTRTSTGLEVQVLQDNAVVFTATDTTSLFSTFNEIAIGTGTNQRDFTIDNVVLSTAAVPEPTSAAVAALALCALAARRRRAR